MSNCSNKIYLVILVKKSLKACLLLGIVGSRAHNRQEFNFVKLICRCHKINSFELKGNGALWHFGENSHWSDPLKAFMQSTKGRRFLIFERDNKVRMKLSEQTKKQWWHYHHRFHTVQYKLTGSPYSPTLCRVQSVWVKPIGKNNCTTLNLVDIFICISFRLW